MCACAYMFCIYILGNEPSTKMVSNQSQKPECAKTGNAKCEDLSRSIEINVIWTFDTEYLTLFNKTCTYITIKFVVKHRQLSYGYPRGKPVHIAMHETSLDCVRSVAIKPRSYDRSSIVREMGILDEFYEETTTRPSTTYDYEGLRSAAIKQWS